jgi:hypothetical protein
LLEGTRGGDGGGRVSFCGGARFVLVGSYGAAIVLGRHKGGFFSDGIAKYGFDILVTTLVRFPVVISERLVNGMDVELVDEPLMGIGVWSCGGHYELECIVYWRSGGVLQ